jgi:hypothetical protein
MQIFHKTTPQGPITQVQHTAPDGSPAASSFIGTLNQQQIERQLNINRAMDAQVKKVAS